jgi:ABC-type multidrug transport system fused ATPase/permease subunit
MEIKNSWQELNREENLLPKGDIVKGMHLKKEDVIRKLNKRLAWKIVFTAVLTPFYFLAVYIVASLIGKALFTFIGLFHIAGLVFFIRRYRIAKAFDPGAMSAKEVLKAYLENIRKTVSLEERAGLLLYPFAGAAGYVFSLSQAGKMEEAMASAEMWLVLLITLIVITPLAHFSAKWLNRKTFKAYTDLLEKRLAQLEED